MKKKKKHNKRKITRRIVSVISILGFLISSAALLYPVISDRWNRYRDMQLISDYNKIISETDQSRFDELWEKAEEYNRLLLKENRNIVTDAEYEPDAYYETLLDIMGNGMMCYIEIPKIDVTEPVYHYSTEVSLGYGVGHIHGSSLPIGGKTTHSILTGHRGLPNQKFFSDLDKLTLGDRFFIHILGQTLAYKVKRRMVILPTDVDHLFIEDNRDLMTLVTCEPYGVNTHRLVITGERIPFSDEYVENGFVTTEKRNKIVDPAVWVFAGFILFIVLMVIITVVRKVSAHIRKKRKLRTVKEKPVSNEEAEDEPEEKHPPDEPQDSEQRPPTDDEQDTQESTDNDTD